MCWLLVCPMSANRWLDDISPHPPHPIPYPRPLYPVQQTSKHHQLRQANLLDRCRI